MIFYQRYKYFLKLILCLLMVLLLKPYSVEAQQLDKIGKDSPVKVSGGISVNQTAYSAWGIDSRRDPYRYVMSGNLNFDIYGMQVPLSFSYSNQNFSYQQPFNQFALAPSYKWLKFQLGYSSMSFSPYTLGGHTFFGGGVEGSPSDKWDFAVMYGRLRKAVEVDTLNTATVPAYQRMGYGFKTEYKHANGNLGITFFKGEDDPSSLKGEIPEGLLPEENLAVSIYAGQKMGNLTVQAEVASSMLTHDMNASSKNDASSVYGWLYEPKTSSSVHWAFNGGVSYQLKGWNVGATYERIEPEYRTLGNYYANNDLETASVNIAGQLFNGKVSLSTNIGGQRDNLSGDKASDMTNMNVALNLSWAATEKLNLTGSYSNFRSYTVIRSQFEQINQADPLLQLDTLNYTQLTDAGNLGVNWMLSSSKEKSQSLALNLNYQQTGAEQSDQSEELASSRFWNGATSWSWAHRPSDWRLGLSANVSYSEANAMTPSSLTLGPTFSANKGFLDKKLKTRTSLSYNQSMQDGETQGTVISWRLGASTSIKKAHNLNFNTVLLNRETNGENKQAFTELTITLGYSYRFSGLKKEEKPEEQQ
ncbi:hypothetical protein V6R21_04400 [Limibacter armeniacum]|uniref:hypothetical protein n=1 Tax=Limibacter armeniacum TaxID=466084 RepID=UPI002FE65CEC